MTRSAQDAGPTRRVLAPIATVPVTPLAGPPRFSIVIPAFQAAETIGDALASAVAQTHPAHEIIVVDDGSTDDLLSALGPARERVKLIRKDNGGGASALNVGAAVASGEFLAILDADDVYHPRRLEALAELAMSRPDLDLVSTDARFILGAQCVGRFLAYNRFDTENQRTAILDSCFVGGWPAVRLAALRAIGGFDERCRISYDWDCWVRLILEGAKAGVVDEPYYDYRLHASSLTASRLASLWERVRVLEKAAHNPALHDPERPVLARSLRRHRTRAVLAETDSFLITGGSRRRLLRLAASDEVAARGRIGAAVAVIAPPLARRIVPKDAPPGERHARAGS